MKRGFTLVEVSILLVIFLIVALLVAPMSLDDTVQAKNTSRWRNVQTDFANIFYSINTQKNEETAGLKEIFDNVISNEIKNNAKPYKITFLNGTYPNATYRFTDFKLTQAGSVLAYKFYDKPQNDIQGVFMYDVNGATAPNKWGKDVFGFNIYSDKFEPFCKNDSINAQRQDCSKNGSGLCCSNYYLIGGSFD